MRVIRSYETRDKNLSGYKLTVEDKVAIKALVSTGRFKQTEVAKLFDVTRARVCQLVMNNA